MKPFKTPTSWGFFCVFTWHVCRVGGLKEPCHLTSGKTTRRQGCPPSPEKIKNFKDKIRQLTPRDLGINVEAIIKRLNPVLRGCTNYSRIANCKKLFA